MMNARLERNTLRSTRPGAQAALVAPAAPPVVRPLQRPISDEGDLLVPTDFSAGSRAALRVATRLAHRDDAQVRLIHVYDAPPRLMSQGATGIQTLFAFEEEAMSRLHALARSVDADVEVEFRVGDPPSVIARRAEELEAQRIVMGAHRRPGPGPVGSVARAVKRTAECPVVLVGATRRAAERDARRRAGGANA